MLMCNAKEGAHATQGEPNNGHAAGCFSFIINLLVDTLMSTQLYGMAGAVMPAEPRR